MAINTGKVVTGGFAAGVVLNVLDFLTNTFITAESFKADLDALNPALMAKMEAPNTIVAFVVLDLVLGLILVWSYAAIRPRFGAGVSTAITAGVLVWAISTVTWFFTVVMGLFSLAFFAKGAVLMLVSMLVAAYVGGMLYKEE